MADVEQDEKDEQIRALTASLRELRGRHYHLFNVTRQRGYHAAQREKDFARELKRSQKHLSQTVKWLDQAQVGARKLFKTTRWKLANLFGKTNGYPPLAEAVDAWKHYSQKNGPIETRFVPTERLEDTEESLQVPFQTPTVDVVICIWNALDDVKVCLESVIARSPKMQQLILVNDGSEPKMQVYLEEFAERCPYPIEIIHNVEQLGYTIAANQGMRRSPADYVMLLNSDTIVPFHWIETLVACGESDEKIGIIGPLSNAASWQSVPERYDGSDWAVNALPEGITVDDVAARLLLDHEPEYPRVPLINGFCLGIKRSVYNAIGYFDEETFPKGYGEENDFCLRAGEAGFELAIADNGYIFHAKSKSFTHATRHVLSKGATEKLHAKHGQGKIDAACLILRDSTGLERARKAFAELQSQPVEQKVLFLMDFKGSGGGTHSIAQECNGLCELGCFAQMAVPAQFADFYADKYPGIPKKRFYRYQNEADLRGYAENFDTVVATLFTSVDLLKSIRGPQPAYYIQDYEPMFYDEGNPLRERAKKSYTLVPGMRHFSKTQWLCDTVTEHHPEVEMHKIIPSIDHSVYTSGDQNPTTKPRVVSAMIRPSTPRRSPQVTMRILTDLKAALGDDLRVILFGCEDGDVFWKESASEFDYENRGVLTREGVAEVLKESHVFLDLSTYQAFGRTALEAMACGCVPVVPASGGTGEYARDGENCRVVDTEDYAEIFEASRDLLSVNSLEAMRAAALSTADDFTVEKAAESMRRLFAV